MRRKRTHETGGNNPETEMKTKGGEQQTSLAQTLATPNKIDILPDQIKTVLEIFDTIMGVRVLYKDKLMSLKNALKNAVEALEKVGNEGGIYKLLKNMRNRITNECNKERNIIPKEDILFEYKKLKRLLILPIIHSELATLISRGEILRKDIDILKSGINKSISYIEQANADNIDKESYEYNKLSKILKLLNEINTQIDNAIAGQPYKFDSEVLHDIFNNMSNSIKSI